MKDELLTLVDEEDNVLGPVPRKEVRAKGLLHRGAIVLLKNSKGEFFVHKRTMTKDTAPGMYDVVVGGAVNFGESYEDAAKRELLEEVGIKDAKLDFLFHDTLELEKGRNWAKVFVCVYDGELKLQKEEIEHGRFMPVEELEKLMLETEFCKAGVRIFRKYQKVSKRA